MAEIILTVVVEVVKCLAPPVYRQISYLREKHQVDEAKRKGEEIEENVKNWLAGGNNVIEEANKFTEDEAAANKRCFKGLCPNLKTRRRLSKEAVRLKEAIVKVRDARRFDRISYSIIAEDTLLMSNKDYEAFESRTSILNEIIDALKNPDVNMLGIYGMGGIGKTTLAKEVARKAESDKLFDQVVFSEVSESQDVRKIQGEIADKLGLKFDEESESGRARRLYDRLKKEKRILVILDNIWGNLDLKAAGIPHGDDHRGCKVLLTARSLDTLSRKMDSQKNFSVSFLKEEEAWRLFKKMAGDYVEGNELKEVARDVAKECAGLPVSIATVARALRNKSIREWRDALEKLGRPSLTTNFISIQSNAYQAIKLSYDNLQGEDLKKTFLLIGYTAIESIDELLIKNEEFFSMHDVVRDVAISIASTERNVFTATNEQVRVVNLTYMILRSLPSSLGLLSNLRTLSLCRCSLLDISVVGDLKKLEVLCLRGSMIKKLPVEVGELSWLKLLDLRDCRELKLIPPNILSKLSRLEELYIGRISFDKWEVEVEGVKNASLEELKHLPNLTSLELAIHHVSTLPRGLFLEKLERYSIRIGDWFWERTNIWCREFRLELNSKICLKDSLIVQLQRIEDLELRGLQEQDVDYFLNELVKVGSSHLKRLSMWGSDLALNPAESKRQEETANDLRSHEIILEDNVQTSNTLFIEKVALPNLENLKLDSINVERIWQNQVAAMSCGIQNLLHLTLDGCWNLRCLFSSSTICSFVRLQRIEIVGCPVLEELIVIDNQEERKSNIVMFPQLQYLKMSYLEKFKSFCTGDLDILEFPSLKRLRISGCPEFMVRYKRNTNILTERGCDHLVNLVPSSTSFQNLTNLVVSCCERLKIVLTSSIAKTLVRLRFMKIESCDRITEIVLADDVVAKDEVITFRELKELKLLDLKSLTSFCSGNCAFKFPSLERLMLDDCPDMKIFSEGKLSTPKLHKVQRRGEACWAWKDDLNTTIKKVNFPRMVAGVWSDDSGLQLEATTWFRNLLSIGRSPPKIEKVIQSGVVPRFVEFLMREDNPQLQFEAVRILAEIASGTSKNIKVVIDHGAVPIFVKLLACPSDDVREQAVWALGNVAVDSPRCRDLVLSDLIPLLAQLNEHANLSMLRTATRTLSNLCKDKPQPPFDQVRVALPVLAQLVHSNDGVVLRYACQALAYLSDGTNDKIQAVIEADVCPRLVKLLGDPWSSVLSPALRTVGNIVKGDDLQTQYIINCGALPYLRCLLINNHLGGIRKEACWIISNITARNREQIQAVIDVGLIGHLVKLLQVDIKEAAQAISNATLGGTHGQIKYLVREGCIKLLCDHLQCPDPWIVTACLKGLENILKVGEAEKNRGAAIRGVNQYGQLVEEVEGFVKIGILRSHDNHEISEKAVEILETYWCLGEDHDTKEEDAQGSGY
ncbi:hypothetical protein CUMW_220120 [Citrus unshiu]|uniref:Uncharacterized protein n=1 Tax=Citrus unshiu TaxID=55188 RepID=A0A2H5QER9_CITUN|nr:hypothetical protein CUMW_220120 [Citrus unshiu]